LPLLNLIRFLSAQLSRWLCIKSPWKLGVNILSAALRLPAKP